MTSIAKSLAAVKARIAAIAQKAGRDPNDVTLIAVAKTHPASAVTAALGAGQTVFGENRVQEAQAKYTDLRAAHPALRLHLIGPLQTNKARQAVALFDAIHSLDRDRLAATLAEEMTRAGRRLPCFIQVNTGAEPQKAGVLPADADRFIDACRDTHNLAIAGLMCIPPAQNDPRPHFALLRDIAARHGLAGLSMGMSDDFEIAIAEGATHVRVGSAIFGSRA
jgi:pyridoxal phosphate enzyme (YggS family)